MNDNKNVHAVQENQYNLSSEKRFRPKLDTDSALIDFEKRLKAVEAHILHLQSPISTEEISLQHDDLKNTNGFREKVRNKLTKSTSFNRPSTSKNRRRSPFRHTVPSDKDEALRIDEFRQQCLSKALKSNYVDIVNYYTKTITEITMILPLWLSDKERRMIQKKTDIRYQSRTFLSILREKDFQSIRTWLEEKSRLSRVIIDHIWKTYQEFNDVELIMNRMCTFCLLKQTVDVKLIIDHLFSIEILSEELFNEINSSEKNTGSQESLWLKVATECNAYPIRSYVREALRLGVVDILDMASRAEDQNVLNRILKDLNENADGLDVFVCRCKEICSKFLQPISLLKSMSLVNIYSSPSLKRETRRDKDAEDEYLTDIANCNIESTEPTESHLRMKDLKDFDSGMCTTVSKINTDNDFESISSNDQRRRSRGKKAKDTTGEFRDRSTFERSPHSGFRDFRVCNIDADNSSSGDSLDSPSDIRTNTQKLYGRQEKIKDTTKHAKSNSFNITAGKVYIQSAHISKTRCSSSSEGTSAS